MVTELVQERDDVKYPEAEEFKKRGIWSEGK
jgi:hypothetical protein